MSDSRMREAFLRLRSEFLDVCKGRIGVLRRQMGIIRGDAGETERVAALDMMRREAHTIAGSSGTYGFSGVSECARALEEACNRSLSDNEDALSDVHMVALTECHRNLLVAAEEMFANPETGTVPF